MTTHPIPIITDPMGQYWNQPNRLEILIDPTYAVMTRKVFDELREYSASKPSGAYPGKMWKRHDGAFDREFRAQGGKPEWLLCWYGIHPTVPEQFVTNNFRKILLSDGELSE